MLYFLIEIGSILLFGGYTMYELLMTVFGVLFVALVACRMYLVHRTRVRKQRAAEEERNRALEEKVKLVLDPYWSLDVAARDEARKDGRLQKVFPLMSDRGLTHR
ncbi:MAG: hypothetical protein HYW56_01850 [Candidatus Harrisonbacteria bacterium]|nr:hypothetical protein [Candidatus Harrisonbacteria bacterium]